MPNDHEGQELWWFSGVEKGDPEKVVTFVVAHLVGTQITGDRWGATCAEWFPLITRADLGNGDFSVISAKEADPFFGVKASSSKTSSLALIVLLGE